MTDAKAIADAYHAHAVKVKRQDPDHESCPGSPRYDPQLGVVCYCGDLINAPRDADLMAPAKPLPPSETTREAERAQALTVPESTAVVKDVDGISSAVHPADPILSRIEIIDPTQPYDSKMVEEHLLEAVRRLEQGAHFERVCAEDYADKVIRYELAFQRAVVKAAREGGNAQLQKAKAMTECESAYLDRMIAKMKLDAIQGTMHSLRSVISAYQSVMKSIASAYSGTQNSNPRF